MYSMLVWLAALTGGDGCVGPDCAVGSRDVDPPIVSMRVLAPAKSSETGLIRYRILLTNRSSAPAFSVQIKLQLPRDAGFVESRPVDPLVHKDLLTWDVGEMPGQSGRLLEVALKTKSDGPLEACFRVAFEHGVCVTTQASCKKPPSADEKLPLPKPPAQLTVVKIAPAKQGLGTPILYSLTVTNPGPLPIKDVELEDLFPPNSSYVPSSASDGGQVSGPEGKKVVWKFPVLLPRESRTVTFKVKPNVIGNYLNVAHAKGIDPDGQSVTSKDATATTEVSGAATLYMEVRDLVDPLFVNDETEYRVFVKNIGSAAATNIRIVCDAPEGLSIVKLFPKLDADASGFRSGEQRVSFPAFQLQPGQEKEYRVQVRAQKAGLFRFRSTLTSEVLDSAKLALVEEETTTVVTERPVDSLTRAKHKVVEELASKRK